MLYKYRTIDNFKNFVDILINERLYAAPYFDMNDPMEGYYRYSTYGALTPDVIKIIKGEKEKIRICSLSRIHDISLMWAHYTNGHRGVVIGVEVDNTQYDLRPVQYDGQPIIADIHMNGPTETAKRILSHKHEVWSYEEEERIFITGGAMYASVKVKEVILGQKMSPHDKNIVKTLVAKIRPEAKVTSNRSIV